MNTIPTDDPRHAAATDLEVIVNDLNSLYARLETLAESRHGAIRRADRETLAACIGEEGVLVQHITEIEARRASAIKRLKAADNERLRDIAARIGGSLGDRLLSAADQLRARVQRVSHINNASRDAAEALSRHMDGLWRGVLRELDGASVYTNAGNLRAPHQALGLDVRS